MKTVLFYGAPKGCSFGAMVALTWLEQPYHLCRIEMMERPWNPIYAKVNPLFLTPALLSDGQCIIQSMAILQHLASRDESFSLYAAQGSREFDLHNQWLAYLHTGFFSAFTPLWILYEAKGLGAGEKALLRRLGEDNVRRACRYLDQCLDDGPWLLGSSRSLADAYLAGLERWIDYHQLSDVAAGFPRLTAYRERLGQDPGVQLAAAIEAGEPVAPSGNFQGHTSLKEVEQYL